MGIIQVSEEIKEAQIEAVIIRSDGTRENLGTVSYYHKNPLKRLKHRFEKFFNGNRSS